MAETLVVTISVTVVFSVDTLVITISVVTVVFSVDTLVITISVVTVLVTVVVTGCETLYI